MDFRRTEILLDYPVKSLCWRDDELIDWSEGNRVFTLDGKITSASIGWDYRFDSVVLSPSKKYAVVHEKLGTKAILLKGCNKIRELNRSCYQADTYEYPIAFIKRPDGSELIGHCPDEYNRIEIEEVESGKRLTLCEERKPDDFFHSRLMTSPDHQRLISAGWIWHPFSTVASWIIEDVLEDPRKLDQAKLTSDLNSWEINGIIPLDRDRILVNSSLDRDRYEDERDLQADTGKLAIFNLLTRTYETIVNVQETIGNMLWLGDDKIVGFFENPKLIDMRTGIVLERWTDLSTGKQDSSIIHHLGVLPPVALDALGKRFAVASEDRITIIEF